MKARRTLALATALLAAPATLPGQATVATGSVAALFQSGADEPLTYGFTGTAVATLQALGLTSGGVALSYAIAGGHGDGVCAGRQHGVHVPADRGGELDLHAG